MAIAGLKVLSIGQTWPFPKEYEVNNLDQASEIVSTIARFQPDVIVTSKFIPGVLQNQSFDAVRKRWIHVPQDASLEAVMLAIENCYIFNIWSDHPGRVGSPLVSVYTPTHNTGDHLREAYQSLRDQTYTTWEWVVVDDCSKDGTWERLVEMAKDDVRVKPFRAGKNFHKIGAIKDTATRMCKGEYLVELDHDDMLCETALEEIRSAFEADPEVGFVFSNSSNFFENGQFQKFEDDFWKNRYRETEYRGKKWTESINPDFYERWGNHFTEQVAWYLTVGPNHVRSFRTKTFFELGGYNPNLLIADDWDLMARFYLHSKVRHINKLLYLYRIKDNWENTTFTKNQAIQDHLTLGRGHYAAEFEAKNKELLEGKKEEPKREGEEEVLLTIAVCTMPSRMKTTLIDVMDELFRQAEGKPVEVFCFLDNRKSNLSEKRNVVIGSAKGKFISFVDDDDRVEPDYVESILEEIRKAPDADCVVFDVLVYGYTAEPRICKYDVSFSHGDDGRAYYRKPNHVMAYRTAISRKHKYRKDLSAISEDTEWADRASLDIKKQVRIGKVLYHYLYNAKETTQVNPAPQAGAIKVEEKIVAPAPPPVPPSAELLPAAPVAPVMPSPEMTTLMSNVSFVVLEALPDVRTARCLRSIKYCAPGAEIVLVSNGSKPLMDTIKLADKVVHLDTNLGFAAGCNVGAEAATKKTVCFMNNDAFFVDSETPQRLLEGLNDEFGIVGPYSNRAKPPQGDIERLATPSRDQFPNMVVGLCMMVDREFYRKLGGFDPRLLTFEDDDFCLRALQAGKRSKVVGKTWVDHERHVTFKGLGLDVDRVMAENGEIFKRKNPRIRVIVIAKNEERSIAGFFMQFANVTQDWCVLDTGSTDRTVEVSRALGAKVETAPFMDFASARNEALNRFRDGADWIVMFDPDERLDRHTVEHLKELVFRTKYDIFLSPLEAVYPDGTKRMFVAKPFLFRNLPGIKWVFKVHEKLIGSKNQALVKNAMNTHWLNLHDDGRRQRASTMYDELMRSEPYFTEPSYKEWMIKEWPILDYDRMDDSRLAKIYAGPLISVVIPTFKRLEMLFNKAVSSVLGQDYPNFEILIVGDACPMLAPLLKLDDSVKKKFDPRIRLFNLASNHGAGGAEPRNHAIMAAAGQIIAYLDDDNAWKPDHLSSVYQAMQGAGASFAFSSMEVDGVDMGFTEPKFQGIDTSCVIHRKSLIDKYGFWKDRVTGGYAHDWEFIGRWVNSKEKWACTKKPTVEYNADTSGQKDFLKKLAEKNAQAKLEAKR